MRYLLPSLLGIIAACKPTVTTLTPVSTPIDPMSSQSSTLVTDRVTDGMARVRRTGIYGLPVAGDAPTISLDGSDTLAAANVYGVAKVAVSVGVHQLAIDGGEPTSLVSLPGPLDIVHFDPGWWSDGQTITSLVSAGLMGVAAMDNKIVSLEAGGGLSVLATLDAPVLGLRAARLGDDALRDDVVAWTASKVLLLRYSQGDWVLAGLLQSQGQVVVGAAVGALANDGAPALAVAWAQDEGGIVEVWQPDSQGILSLIANGELSAQPTSMAISDGAQGAIITVVEQNAWQRLARVGTSLIDVAGDPPVALPLGSQVWGGIDLDGDDAEELVFAGDDTTGGTQVLILSLDRPDPIYVTRSYVSAILSFGDTDGDGRDDLLALESTGNLRRYAVSAQYGRKEWNLGSLSPVGPFAILPAAPGEAADLVLGGDGRLVRVSGGPDEDSPWDMRTRRVMIASNIVPEQLLRFDAGEGSGSFAAIVKQHATDAFQLSLFHWVPGTDSGPHFDTLDSWQPQADEVILDAEFCDDNALVVTDTRVIALHFDTAQGLQAQGEKPYQDAVKVSCVTEGDHTVFGVLRDGGVQLLNFDGAVLQEGDMIDAPAAQNLALAPSNPGDVGPQVRTCASAGCEITAWLRPNAAAVYATMDSAGLTLDGTGDLTALPWQGPVVLGDVDGDGVTDLAVLQDNGSLGVLRGLAKGGPVFPEPTTRLASRGGSMALLVDVDGDKRDDVLTINISGAIAAWIDLGSAR